MSDSIEVREIRSCFCRRGPGPVAIVALVLSVTLIGTESARAQSPTTSEPVLEVVDILGFPGIRYRFELLDTGEWKYWHRNAQEFTAGSCSTADVQALRDALLQHGLLTTASLGVADRADDATVVRIEARFPGAKRSLEVPGEQAFARELRRRVTALVGGAAASATTR